jgi:hypothetical protein
MSLQWELSPTVPADTADLARRLYAPDDFYIQVGNRWKDLFPEQATYTPLYHLTGRSAIPPQLLDMVTLFQHNEKLPDRVATRFVISRIDWKYALHLPMSYSGFCFTDLSAFRGRLKDDHDERRLFDQTVTTFKDAGLIRSGGKMRTDSTHILAVVARLGCLELVTESIRSAVSAVCALAANWVTATIPPPFQESYQHRQSEYGLSDSAVLEKLRQAGRDGFWFVAAWDQAQPVPPDAEPASLVTLRTVLQQQFPSGPDGIPPAKRPRGHDVIDSPHETEARTAAKRGRPWTGYKAQVTETCDADAPHLIADIAATNACVNDSPELPTIQARLVAQGTVPAEQYVDEGYPSGVNLVKSAAMGITLMGRLEDVHGVTGFRQTDFQIDEVARQARCPAGHLSTYWHEDEAPPGGDRPVKIRFDRLVCRACPFFGRCTTSEQGRSLELHPFRVAIAQQRLLQETEAFRDKMHVRAGVEGTISELVRVCGLRYARYRGLVNLRLQCCYSAVVINLRRLIRWWTAQQPAQAI